MITTQTTAIPVPADNLQKLLYSDALIKQLAVQLTASQVEAHLDMMSDFIGEYKTFDEAELCIKGAKDSVEDMVDDLLTDFRDQLYAALANVNITVTAVKFEREGAVDADVTVC